MGAARTGGTPVLRCTPTAWFRLSQTHAVRMGTAPASGAARRALAAGRTPDGNTPFYDSVRSGSGARAHRTTAGAAVLPSPIPTTRFRSKACLKALNQSVGQALAGEKRPRTAFARRCRAPSRPTAPRNAGRRGAMVAERSGDTAFVRRPRVHRPAPPRPPIACGFREVVDYVGPRALWRAARAVFTASRPPLSPSPPLPQSPPRTARASPARSGRWRSRPPSARQEPFSGGG